MLVTKPKLSLRIPCMDRTVVARRIPRALDSSLYTQGFHEGRIRFEYMIEEFGLP